MILNHNYYFVAAVVVAVAIFSNHFGFETENYYFDLHNIDYYAAELEYMPSSM